MSKIASELLQDIEKDTVISDNADEIISVMQDKGCVMAGTAETKDERKIKKQQLSNLLIMMLLLNMIYLIMRHL